MYNEFINHNIENLSLIGGPGTGKTKIIIDYCIEKFTRYQKKFLIITFSNKAINDIITKGNQIQKIFTTSNVKTINLLAINIYKSLFNKTSNNTNAIILALYKSLLNLDILLNSINYLNNYNFIIIDEAHDINENQYNLIKLISDKLNIPIILVGDPNQNIYQFNGGNNKYLLNHSNKIIYLTENFRSSKQIIDFTNYLKPHSMLMVSTKNNDCRPIIYSKSINNILNNIIKELNKKTYNLKDIAIIGPIKKMKYNGLDLE
jgi:superfamily I DNA/RNA helicase